MGAVFGFDENSEILGACRGTVGLVKNRNK